MVSTSAQYVLLSNLTYTTFVYKLHLPHLLVDARRLSSFLSYIRYICDVPASKKVILERNLYLIVSLKIRAKDAKLLCTHTRRLTARPE